MTSNHEGRPRSDWTRKKERGKKNDISFKRDFNKTKKSNKKTPRTDDRTVVETKETKSATIPGKIEKPKKEKHKTNQKQFSQGEN